MKKFHNGCTVAGLASLFWLVPASACTDGPHQTVSWYMAHNVEREAKINWCSDDMARGNTADCMNALKARSRMPRQGPAWEVKPMPAKDKPKADQAGSKQGGS
jgi:hypothetical protein